MRRLAVLLVAAVPMAVLAPSASTAPRGAIATALQVVHAYGRNGSPAVAYALLHPAQQVLIPRDRFIACTLEGRAGNLPRTTYKVVRAAAWKVNTTRTPQRRGEVVTIDETFHPRNAPADSNRWSLHLVSVYGQWRWLIDWPTAYRYRDHLAVCPD